MSNITPVGVLTFVNLFEPKLPPNANETARPRYSLNLVLDKAAQTTDEYKKMRQNVMAAAREKWGDRAEAMFKSGSIRSPFRDCGEKDYSGYDVEGGVYINLWSHDQPSIVDGSLHDVIDPRGVYSGCLGRASYRCFAYDVSGNKGVSFGLQNVQVTDATQPRLDGRKAARDEFDSFGESPKQDEFDDVPF